MDPRVTPEMRVTFAMLRSQGVDFYPTEERRLPCGCVMKAGWLVTKEEGGLGFFGCSPAHQEAYRRAHERWGTPESVGRFWNVLAVDALVTLVAEEIEAARARPPHQPQS